jgi:hypothetical protein
MRVPTEMTAAIADAGPASSASAIAMGMVNFRMLIVAAWSVGAPRARRFGLDRASSVVARRTDVTVCVDRFVGSTCARLRTLPKVLAAAAGGVASLGGTMGVAWRYEGRHAATLGRLRGAEVHLVAPSMTREQSRCDLECNLPLERVLCPRRKKDHVSWRKSDSRLCANQIVA